MGCCFPKKSHENRITRDKSLLNDTMPHDQRGLTLNGEESIPPSQDPSFVDYEPPQLHINDLKTTKVVTGKSLLRPPTIDDLNKAEMIEKRGHVVFSSCYSHHWIDSKLEKKILCVERWRDSLL
jgi:hypothetical protein